MRIRATVTTAIITGALIAGLGATPALATTTSASSTAAIGSRAGDVRAVTGVDRIAPTDVRVPTGEERSDHGVEARETRVLPVIAAIAAAFVAAARAVPGLLKILKPFASKGASAFYAAVKAKAPGAVKVILAGVAGNAAYDRIKVLLGW